MIQYDHINILTTEPVWWRKINIRQLSYSATERKKTLENVQNFCCMLLKAHSPSPSSLRLALVTLAKAVMCGDVSLQSKTRKQPKIPGIAPRRIVPHTPPYPFRISDLTVGRGRKCLQDCGVFCKCKHALKLCLCGNNGVEIRTHSWLCLKGTNLCISNVILCWDYSFCAVGLATALLKTLRPYIGPLLGSRSHVKHHLPSQLVMPCLSFNSMGRCKTLFK